MGGNPFWIHDPTTVTVCDEFVYALLVTLDRHAAVLTRVWSDLSPRDNPGAPPFEIPNASGSAEARVFNAQRVSG